MSIRDLLAIGTGIIIGGLIFSITTHYAGIHIGLLVCGFFAVMVVSAMELVNKLKRRRGSK